jgi:hypothetical protein
MSICDTIQTVEVALLAEDVAFALPFPDEELTEFGATYGDPFGGCVLGKGGDGLFGDGEGLDLGEVGEFVD